MTIITIKVLYRYKKKRPNSKKENDTIAKLYNKYNRKEIQPH